ncbi:OLC1v1035179C1 [Oldenlandia corymbosa var. corymbosa]|uniref:OLC1v1035179C1 n=1 Tax=Oldenlandia corymbosa var. corymbosa TaxID=529605 RepID=A0AAV1CSF4_OLDCO|nr:OLC1v1035179C1 [Oldenlandia corymbosa var. corymbosa]
MEADKELTGLSNAETKSSILFLPELFEDDPFFQKKKKLLEDLSLDGQEIMSLKSSSSPSQWKDILDIMLKRARIINLNEIELYFAGADVYNFVSPRNELEALHSVIGLVESSMSSDKHEVESLLGLMHKAAFDLIHQLGEKVGEETRVVRESSCEKENSLMQWGKSNGVNTKLEITYVEGAGRGAIATENLKVGDIAMEIPLSLLICDKDVIESDMFPILKKIDGIESETMLLLWSMKEKHNLHSKYKLYFESLPEAFNTGLSFGVSAIMGLDGTILLEEIVQAKEHLRTQYEQLFPAICESHPDIFPAELYTWEQFLWACELWYSNSMKIMFDDGKLRTCLVPIAGFLNHSTCPHILHYGKTDPVTKSVKFPLSRPCNAGDQCFLSYGNFSSSHLLTFYGFMPKQENPYDVIPLDFDIATDEDCVDGEPCEWGTHMVRGTWFSKNNGIFNYGLPPPLLDHLRRARGSTSKAKTRVMFYSKSFLFFIFISLQFPVIWHVNQLSFSRTYHSC